MGKTQSGKVTKVLSCKKNTECKIRADVCCVGFKCLWSVWPGGRSSFSTTVLAIREGRGLPEGNY